MEESNLAQKKSTAKYSWSGVVEVMLMLTTAPGPSCTLGSRIQCLIKTLCPWRDGGLNNCVADCKDRYNDIYSYDDVNIVIGIALCVLIHPVSAGSLLGRLFLGPAADYGSSLVSFETIFLFCHWLC